MAIYNVGDEVVLPKNQEGFIRFKGTLPTKKGIFYGIELTKGIGKNNGDFDGVRYFDCAEGRGLFVPKKRIISKKMETANRLHRPQKQNKHQRRSNGDGDELIKKTETESASKQNRKSLRSESSDSSRSTKRSSANSSSSKRNSTKKNLKKKVDDESSGWKAPSWASDVLKEDGTNWDCERRASRGKILDLKAIYDPDAQRKRFEAMGFTDTEIDAMISNWDLKDPKKRPSTSNKAKRSSTKRSSTKSNGKKKKKKKKKKSQEEMDEPHSPILVLQSETHSVDEELERIRLDLEDIEIPQRTQTVQFDAESVRRKKRPNPQYKILGRFCDDDGIYWVEFAEVHRKIVNKEKSDTE